MSTVRSFLLMAMTLHAASCGAGVDRTDGLPVSDSAGIRIITISPPGSGDADVAYADAEWGRDLPIRRIDDARILQDRIALLDGGTGELWVFEEDAGRMLTFGGIRNGHPAAVRPTAFASFEGGVAVWDRGLLQFTVFDRRGSFVRVIPQRVRGDVPSFSLREDPEDLSMRFRVVRDELWLQLEDSELELRDPAMTEVQEIPRRGAILRVARDGSSVDTVFSYRAATYRVVPEGLSHRGGILLPEARWAVHDTLFAWGRSDTTEIRLYHTDGSLRSILRWSPVRNPIGNQEKRDYARAWLRETPNMYPSHIPAAERQAAIDAAADRLATPDVAPEFSALLIHGACLWVASYDLESSSDGRSRTWSYHRLDDGAGDTVVFDSIPMRIMDIGATRAVGRLISDDDGVHYIRSYPLPARARETCRG
jgi:hypothetical protein